MATNPRIPLDERKKPQLVPPLRPRHGKRPRRRMLPAFLVVAGVALMVGLLGLVLMRATRTSPRPAAVNTASLLPQANNDQLRVDGVQINSGNPGGVLSLEGRITNTGQHSLNGAAVEIVFRDPKGNIAGKVERPIAGLSGGNCEVDDEFARHPIKPSDLRVFCVTVNPIPNGWNHEPPEMQVVTVTSPE